MNDFITKEIKNYHHPRARFLVQFGVAANPAKQRKWDMVGRLSGWLTGHLLTSLLVERVCDGRVYE